MMSKSTIKRAKRKRGGQSAQGVSVRGQQSSAVTNAFLLCEVALKRFIGRFLYRPEDVEELAQETFLRAYNASKTTEVHSPEAYLFRVAKHIALKELDLKSTRMTDYLEEAVDQELLEGGDTVEEELMAEQQISHYCEAIATMPPQCRKVFIMRKVQARSYREICDKLNISISAVEKHIASGIERLDDYMVEHDIEYVRQSRAEKRTSRAVGETISKESL